MPLSQKMRLPGMSDGRKEHLRKTFAFLTKMENVISDLPALNVRIMVRAAMLSCYHVTKKPQRHGS